MNKGASPKKRVRGCQFEVLANGSVWCVRWNPSVSLVSAWRKGTRQKHTMSGDMLVDAVSGQLPLFSIKPVPVPVTRAEP